VRFGPPRLAMIVAVGVASLVVGCGSNVQREGQQLRAQSLLTSSPPLPRTVVTNQYIAQYPAASVLHAFFSYWQELQFGSWRGAAMSYDPRLRAMIGSETLIGSLETVASFYRAVKPALVRVQTTSYGTTEVSYLGSRSGSPPDLETIEWLRVGGTWRIEWDSYLNEGLMVYAEQAEQEHIDPAAQVLAPRSVQAGKGAGHLQAAYLATLIDEAHAAHGASLHRSP
jgi:hypothetical protein